MKIYDIDRTVANAPRAVRLRGKVYKIRDFTLRDRLVAIHDLAKIEEEWDAAGKNVTPGTPEWHDWIARGQEIITQGVDNALVDVPEEVSSSITTEEYNALLRAVATARGVSPELVQDEEGESEEKD